MLDLPHEAAGRSIVGRAPGAHHWPKVQTQVEVQLAHQQRLCQI